MNPELITHNIHTYGYHIIDDFLEINHYQSLRSTAQEMHKNGLFRSAKIGHKVNKQYNESIRTDEILWLDEKAHDSALQAYLKQTQTVAHILNQHLYLGLFEFETHFAAYQPGSYYKKHVDQFAATKERKISCVYYLNNEWHEHFGGDLNLYSQEDILIKKVAPQGNRFICFNSELPHEVCLTHQTRLSLTGWMKVRTLSYA